MNKSIGSVSVVMPAKNEGQVIASVVAKIRSILPDIKVVVVNDGSTDNTAAEAQSAGAHVISHPYSKGNG
ncbi:MAG: glycosyltransferase, partial [Pseudomonadales bacterium]|nr:glycosyltransferase [Pseudomonadales bacterium]